MRIEPFPDMQDDAELKGTLQSLCESHILNKNSVPKFFADAHQTTTHREPLFKKSENFSSCSMLAYTLLVLVTGVLALPNSLSVYPHTTASRDTVSDCSAWVTSESSSNCGQLARVGSDGDLHNGNSQTCRRLIEDVTVADIWYRARDQGN